VTEGLAKAREWFAKAAAHGNKNAATLLARLDGHQA